MVRSFSSTNPSVVERLVHWRRLTSDREVMTEALPLLHLYDRCFSTELNPYEAVVYFGFHPSCAPMISTSAPNSVGQWCALVLGKVRLFLQPLATQFFFGEEERDTVGSLIEQIFLLV